MIRVSARLFRAVSLFRYLEPNRYYLTGVCIEPHAAGALLVATDGHRMMAALDRRGRCDRTAIIALPDVLDRAMGDDDTLKAARRSHEEDSIIVSVDDDGVAEIVAEMDGSARGACCCEIKGKFADWRAVVPRGALPVLSAPGFNGDYLNEFARAAALLAPGPAMIRIAANGMSDPSLVLFPSCADAFGVVMPMRIDDHAPAAPAWMGDRPFVPPATEAAA